MHFDESMGGINDGSRMPFFIADITLAIPNVVSKRILKTKDASWFNLNYNLDKQQ